MIKSMKSPLMLLCSIVMASVFVFSSDNVEANPGISKQEAIQIVKQKHQGKVLKVQKHDQAYRVKFLTKEGKVRQFHVDKQSGKLLGPKK